MFVGSLGLKAFTNCKYYNTFKRLETIKHLHYQNLDILLGIP